MKLTEFDMGSILSLTPTGCEHRETIVVSTVNPDGENVELMLPVVAYGVVVAGTAEFYCTNVEPIVETPTGWNTVGGAIAEYDDGGWLGGPQIVNLPPETKGGPFRVAKWQYAGSRAGWPVRQIQR